MAVPPDTATAAPLSFTVTALAVDPGVEKTGTLVIADRFDFADSGDPTRILATLDLSKLTD
jgi:hypothetical protein